MEEYLETLKSIPLFKGFAEEEIMPMLDCLLAKDSYYKKGESVYLKDDCYTDIGIIASGKLRVQKEEINGKGTIFLDLYKGDMLSEELFFAGIKNTPFSVWAVEPSKIIFINGKEIFKFCYLACEFHSKLVCNITEILAQKLLQANQKIDIIQKSTIREKLTAFFNIYIEKNKSTQFVIPFKRWEMAEYLCVNRSALSSELCKMRDEGLLEFNRNSFHIIT